MAASTVQNPDVATESKSQKKKKAKAEAAAAAAAAAAAQSKPETPATESTNGDVSNESPYLRELHK